MGPAGNMAPGLVLKADVENANYKGELSPSAKQKGLIHSDSLLNFVYRRRWGWGAGEQLDIQCPEQT